MMIKKWMLLSLLASSFGLFGCSKSKEEMLCSVISDMKSLINKKHYAQLAKLSAFLKEQSEKKLKIYQEQIGRLDQSIKLYIADPDCEENRRRLDESLSQFDTLFKQVLRDKIGLIGLVASFVFWVSWQIPQGIILLFPTDGGP